MKVSELIVALQGMPQDASVDYVWDGDARSTVGQVWLGKGGSVILYPDSDWEPVYSDEARPVGAPLEKDVQSWSPTDSAPGALKE